MRPRIVHLIGTARQENTAIASLVQQIATAAQAGNYESAAIFMDGPGPLQNLLESGGMKTKAITWRGARDLGGHWQLSRALIDLKPDLIHQHFGGWPARLVARVATRAPVILHLHGRDLETRPHGPKVQTTLGASAVIAVSRSVARDAKAGHIHVIPNGIRLPDTMAARANPAHLITASRLVPLRAVEQIIQTLATLPSAQLTILGDGPERPRLVATITEFGLEGRVQLHGWVRDIGPHLMTAGIFVSAARDEGFGLALGQAMAAGLPVVSYDVGAVGELVVHGQTGLLVPPGDIEALGAAVRKLIDSPDLAQAMGASGRQRIAHDFAPKMMTDRILQIYDQFLAPAGRIRTG